MSNILIGMTVAKRDGSQGQVVELDTVKNRARIYWGSNRTWIRYQDLTVIAQPDPPVLDQMNQAIVILEAKIKTIVDHSYDHVVDNYGADVINGIASDEYRRYAKELNVVIDTIKGMIKRHPKFTQAVARDWKQFAPQGPETEFIQPITKL